MSLRHIRCIILLLGSLAPSYASGAEGKIDIPHAQTKPPEPPKSPSEAQAAFSLPRGFRVELAAAEPDLVNPVAMTWDDRGRVWVCESVQYPHREPRPGKDRIRIFEDTDGDGRMDKVKTFADGLNIPSGIAVGYGGAFVSNSPEILFLKDTDGDDVADGREVILNGFGIEDTHELPNTFTWGPDGWLYGLNGVFNPSKITHQGRTWEFTCALWRYHPVTKAFEVFCEGTSNPWGLDYNANGHWFVSACVIDHLWHLTQTGYYHRQAGAYPPKVWKIESIVDHAHQLRAYCGLAFYDADVYPEEFRGDLFMGNIHGNCINRDRLTRQGSTYRAAKGEDFLHGNDVWFMPVSTKVGPDGCFWVLDWYDRYHCYQDANRDPEGIDRGRGRLWRVAYGDAPPAKPFDLGRKSNSELIALLSNPNGWWRRTAQRILIERNDAADVASLKELARSSSPNNAPMHAVWTLIGMGRVDSSFHAELLGHSNPAFRAWSVRAACEKGTVPAELFEKVRTLAQDSSPDVRLEVTIASSRLRASDSLNLLLTALAHKEDDALIPHIAWENLHPRIEEQRAEIVSWLGDESQVKTEGARAVVQRAIGLLVPRGADDAASYSRLLESGLRRGGDSLLLRHCLESLWEQVRDGALTSSGHGRDLFSPEIKVALSKLEPRDRGAGLMATAVLAAWGEAPAQHAAERIIADHKQPLDQRQRMLTAVAITKRPAVIELSGTILKSTSDPPELKRQALLALQSIDQPEIGPLLIGLWPTLPGELRPVAMGALCSRAGWAQVLIDAVEAGRIPKTELNTTSVRQMLRHNQPELTAAIERTWGRLREDRNPDRQRVIREKMAVIKRGKGDAANGQLMFKAHCAQCHKIYGHGMDIGPDITGNGRSDLELIVSNVLDPNLVIGSGYITRTVFTNDGQVFNGILVEDSEERVVVKVAGATEPQIIPRAEIEEMRVSEVSLMPEGIEDGMTHQEFRDLIAFLLTKEPPLPWEQVPDVHNEKEASGEPGSREDSGAR